MVNLLTHFDYVKMNRK